MMRDYRNGYYWQLSYIPKGGSSRRYERFPTLFRATMRIEELLETEQSRTYDSFNLMIKRQEK